MTVNCASCALCLEICKTVIFREGEPWPNAPFHKRTLVRQALHGRSAGKRVPRALFSMNTTCCMRWECRSCSPRVPGLKPWNIRYLSQQDFSSRPPESTIPTRVLLANHFQSATPSAPNTYISASLFAPWLPRPPLMPSSPTHCTGPLIGLDMPAKDNTH